MQTAYDTPADGDVEMSEDPGDDQDFHSDSDISDWSGLELQPRVAPELDDGPIQVPRIQLLGPDGTIEEIQGGAGRHELLQDLRLTTDFQDDEEEAPLMMRPYGFTPSSVLTAIRFLNALPAVNTARFDKIKIQCIICHQHNKDGENASTAHHHKLLRLPCGHRIGKSCLYLHLNPLQTEPPESLLHRIRQGTPPTTHFNAGSNKCPACLQRLFPRIPNGSDILIMRARLRLWDSVYTRYAIPLTPDGQEIRAELQEFFQDYQSIQESLSPHHPWKPYWISRSLFLEISQYMVLYANILLANVDGSRTKGFRVALRFLEHYRDITKPENYDPALWFGTDPWIDEGAMVARMGEANWEKGRMLWKGEEVDDGKLTEEEEEEKKWARMKTDDLARKVRTSLPVREFLDDSVRYCP